MDKLTVELCFEGSGVTATDERASGNRTTDPHAKAAFEPLMKGQLVDSATRVGGMLFSIDNGQSCEVWE